MPFSKFSVYIDIKINQKSTYTLAAIFPEFTGPVWNFDVKIVVKKQFLKMLKCLEF